MVNCELIVRDAGSRLHFVKYLKEAVGTIGLKESKWVVDCMPPYKSTYRDIESVTNSIDDIQRDWKSYESSEDWKIFLDKSVPALHIKIYIPDENQEEFRRKLLEGNINYANYSEPDFTFITQREKREKKLKDILDDN